MKSSLKDLLFLCKLCLSLASIRQNFIVISVCICLAGCVGVVVSMPDPETGTPLTYQTEDADQHTRVVWCGVTLWAVIVPIPLKLPVCKLRKHQTLTSPLYACGPLMLLAPIAHDYKGSGLCGKLPK